MRYIVKSNWLDAKNGMCYCLCDTEIKPSSNFSFPEMLGYSVVEWSYDGGKMQKKCDEMNSAPTE